MFCDRTTARILMSTPTTRAAAPLSGNATLRSTRTTRSLSARRPEKQRHFPAPIQKNNLFPCLWGQKAKFLPFHGCNILFTFVCVCVYVLSDVRLESVINTLHSLPRVSHMPSHGLHVADGTFFLPSSHRYKLVTSN